MNEEDQKILEERKVKALEKIANILDSFTIWFEDINKDFEKFKFGIGYLQSPNAKVENYDARLLPGEMKGSFGFFSDGTYNGCFDTK